MDKSTFSRLINAIENSSTEVERNLKIEALFRFGSQEGFTNGQVSDLEKKGITKSSQHWFFR